MIGLSAKSSILVVLVSLPVYAMVTDANPPIVRATVVAVIIAFGQWIGRSGSPSNALAMAGLVVLTWNPSDLFNPGAQLSFLAVFAILHATNWLKLLHRQSTMNSEDSPLTESIVRRFAVRFSKAAIEANVVGMAVWLMTSPLVAREFHLVSPIGSILTILLVVPVTLCSGSGIRFCCWG